MDINLLKILTLNPVINLLLVNFKKESQINSLKTSIMEDKTVKVKIGIKGRMVKTGTEVKMVRIGMEVKMVPIILVLMVKVGLETMFQATKVGIIKDTNQDNRGINGKVERIHLLATQEIITLHQE